jgi:uncharacterized protein YggE
VVARLLRVVAEYGVAEQDVQTARLDLSPVYQQAQRGQGPPRIAGYRAVNQLTVKVRDLAALGRLLDELVQQAANRLEGLQFVVDDPAALLDEARRKAVADAKRKAALFAEATGVTLGPVTMVQEQAARPPGPYPIAMARATMAEVAVPVAPGEVTFSASVTVRFAIR